MSERKYLTIKEGLAILSSPSSSREDLVPLHAKTLLIPDIDTTDLSTIAQIEGGQTAYIHNGAQGMEIINGQIFYKGGVLLKNSIKWINDLVGSEVSSKDFAMIVTETEEIFASAQTIQDVMQKMTGNKTIFVRPSISKDTSEYLFTFKDPDRFGNKSFSMSYIFLSERTNWVMYRLTIKKVRDGLSILTGKQKFTHLAEAIIEDEIQINAVGYSITSGRKNKTFNTWRREATKKKSSRGVQTDRN